MAPPEPPPPPELCRCGGTLDRIGGATLRFAEKTVVVEHFACKKCGRRRRRHSRSGWADTGVDLAGG